jgi:hypothetical protein
MCPSRAVARQRSAALRLQPPELLPSLQAGKRRSPMALGGPYASTRPLLPGMVRDLWRVAEYPIWMVGVVIDFEPTAVHIGGLVRSSATTLRDNRSSPSTQRQRTGRSRGLSAGGDRRRVLEPDLGISGGQSSALVVPVRAGLGAASPVQPAPARPGRAGCARYAGAGDRRDRTLIAAVRTDAGKTMPSTPYTYTSPDDPAREDEGLFGPGSVTWRVMSSRMPLSRWIAQIDRKFMPFCSSPWWTCRLRPGRTGL